MSPLAIVGIVIGSAITYAVISGVVAAATAKWFDKDLAPLFGVTWPLCGFILVAIGAYAAFIKFLERPPAQKVAKATAKERK